MSNRTIWKWLLAARWLLTPFYAILLGSLVPLFFMSARELWHLLTLSFRGSETDVVLGMLSMLDLVLLANLVMMVAVSSFESYVTRVIHDETGDKPDWLGKLDTGGVKVRVAVSIALIAAVSLLRDFMKDQQAPRELIYSSVVVLTFCVAAFVIDRTGGHDNHQEES